MPLGGIKTCLVKVCFRDATWKSGVYEINGVSQEESSQYLEQLRV